MCASYIENRRKLCLSFHFLNRSYEIKTRDTNSRRYNDVLRRPVLILPLEGPNGRSCSRCHLDAQCGSKRKCMKEDRVVSDNGMEIDRTVAVPCDNEVLNLC